MSTKHQSFGDHCVEAADKRLGSVPQTEEDLIIIYGRHVKLNFEGEEIFCWYVSVETAYVCLCRTQVLELKSLWP